ncbi:MAG: GlsB/YeaQ/YmgE family stress response membrane protein [Anaerolineae bacterium]|nr:GlsB/YeaQ/YmgE family stress response membrane protein [Anaerolineae bacterium]
MLWTIIGWIVVGAIAGWLASIVMGTNRRQSLTEDIIVGVIGGIVGGFILNVLDIGGEVSGINLVSIIVAFFGAIILLLILRAVRGTAQV